MVCIGQPPSPHSGTLSADCVFCGLTSVLVRVTRIYTGDDGQSHFEELEVPLSLGSDRLSDLVPLTGVMFRNTRSGSNLDYHPAPRRQFVVTLTGRVEVGCGDGTARVFGPGDIMLADDLTGQGHTSVQLGNEDRTSLFLVLDADVDLSPWQVAPDTP
jgi:hypothetical protein